MQLIIAVAAILAAAVLAAGGGSGGGALYVPIFTLIYGRIETGIPLSKATIFGVASSALTLNIYKKHPHSKHIPLINYTAAALLEPATLLGAIIGVTLNLYLPPWCITLLLVVCLTITTKTTLKKALQCHRTEQGIFEISWFERAIDYASISHWHRKSAISWCRPRTSSTVELSHTPLLGPKVHSDTQTDYQNSENFDPDNIEQGKNGHYERLASGAKPLWVSNPHRSRSHVSEKAEGFIRTVTPKPAGKDASSTFRDTTNFSVSSTDAFTTITLRVSDAAQSRAPTTEQLYDAARAEQSAAFDGVDWKLEMTSAAYAVFNAFVNWAGLYVSGGPRALFCGDIPRIIVLLCLMAFHIVCIVAFAKYISWTRKARRLEGIVESPTHLGGYSWLTTNRAVGRQALADANAHYYQNLLRLCMSHKKNHDSPSAAKYCSLGMVAGCCAGALGIGGGLIKGPLLLSIGMAPMSAVATSCFMILFTSSATTLSFFLTGRLEVVQGAIFAAAGFAGGFIGLLIVNHFVRKYRKQSIVSFILAIVIFCSLLGMCASMISLQIQGLPSTGTSSICIR